MLGQGKGKRGYGKGCGGRRNTDGPFSQAELDQQRLEQRFTRQYNFERIRVAMSTAKDNICDFENLEDIRSEQASQGRSHEDMCPSHELVRRFIDFQRMSGELVVDFRRLLEDGGVGIIDVRSWHY